MTADERVMIKIEQLGKKYMIYDRPSDRFKQLFARKGMRYYKDFWALNNVSFEILRGESVGIIGRNGAGKSTLLQLITGTLVPTQGNVKVTGKIAALLQLGSGFNPEFTGRENVYLNGAILGFSRAEVARSFDEITDFAEIGEFIDQPVKNYSSGMTMRLAFAVSTCLNPDVLIVDEALAVGDALFQRKCYARMENFVSSGGTLLFVSHSLDTMKRVCDRIIYLKDGGVRAVGYPSDMVSLYEYDLDQLRQREKSGELAVASPPRTYGSEEAEIIETWFENSAGQKVTKIKAGEGFSWCYDLRAHQDVACPAFGMKITTTDGLVVYATNSDLLEEPSADLKAGEMRRVKFRIASNNIAGGDYFFSAGLSKQIEGAFLFLYRLVDVGHLKIESLPVKHYDGIVDLEANLHITLIEGK